mgnify:CR=1 FL=1
MSLTKISLFGLHFFVVKFKQLITIVSVACISNEHSLYIYIDLAEIKLKILLDDD